MRRPILAANWKMHKTVAEALDFVGKLLPQLTGLDEESEIVIAAPFTALRAVRDALLGSPLQLAAQNLHSARAGAFTGEISAAMLSEVGCRYVIVGHSERRSLFGESPSWVGEKLRTALAHGLRPILCVGESLEEREASRTFDVLRSQLDAALEGSDAEQAEEIVIAYEPVWAIGTGRSATPDLAQQAHAFIRERLAQLFGDAAERIRIQYGGSVKPENIASLMAQPDIDGALVGGASLDPASFCAIIRFRSPSEEPAG
ncbi:MAG: triose-phosphate isomerase [Myxococcota bacterium]